jgi:hypothetical protein
MKVIFAVLVLSLSAQFASAGPKAKGEINPETQQVCEISDLKTCALFSINQINRCEGYTVGYGDRALSRWCVDNAVETAQHVTALMGGPIVAEVNKILGRIMQCRYYPSVNSRPYTKDCVTQLTGIAVDLLTP